MSAQAPGQVRVRGDNADEVLRLREALYDQERQTGRWVADAAKWERRAYELSAALAQIAGMAEANGAVRNVTNIANIARDALEGK